MESNLNEFAITFVAKSNNPTILNPDFLLFNKIIPEKWELQQSPICTEPFSQVAFKNGIVITSQLDKIIFTSNLREDSLRPDDLIPVAIHYVQLIRHVNYTSVGINPKFILVPSEGSNTESILLSTFFKEGPWKTLKTKESKASINLHYTFDNYILNLSIVPGILKKTGQQIIIVSANFHHELPKEDGTDKKIEAIITILKSALDYNNVLVKEIINPFFLE